jgi:hypothetical protein
VPIRSLLLTMFALSSASATSGPDMNPWRFDYAEMDRLTAAQFLAELCLEDSDHPVTVRQMDNWVRMWDLPFLISKAQDQTPCRSVVSTYSSFRPRGVSTVGREAKFLILGIKACAYPPALSSLQAPERQLDDALRWGKLMVARGEQDFCAVR